MSQEPKKIVSKGKYAGVKINKIWIYCNALATMIFVPALGYKPLSHLNLPPFWFKALMIGIAIVSVMTFMQTAKSMFQEAKTLDAGVFLTRANTGDLPVQESLVRASTEPTQAQEDILLRPAIDVQERDEEQLLRPS